MIIERNVVDSLETTGANVHDLNAVEELFTGEEASNTHKQKSALKLSNSGNHLRLKVPN